MKKTAFITGATSGIGYAAARILADAGFRIIASGRRTERLDELCTKLGTGNVQTLAFDVRDQASVAEAVKTLPGDWQKIDVLLNNAGNAHGLASFQDGDIADWDAMMDINVKGLLYVSKAVIPLMPPGSHIVNIGSIAGKEVYPNGNVYCASKHAVNALSKAMRMDLLPLGIKVSEINPGLVQTEFSEVRFKGDKEKADAVYQGYQPLTALDIAEIIQFVVTLPPHVNLAEVLVLPAAQASATMVDKKV